MVVELANLLEKVLIDFVKLLQRTEAVWLNERLDILREDVMGRSRVRWSEERLKPVVLIFISFCGIAIKKYEEVHK